MKYSGRQVVAEREVILFVKPKYLIQDVTLLNTASDQLFESLTEALEQTCKS